MKKDSRRRKDIGKRGVRRAARHGGGQGKRAEERALAHALAALKLRFDRRLITLEEYDAGVARAMESPYYTEAMDDAANAYEDTVMEQLAAAGEGARLLIGPDGPGARAMDGGCAADAVIIGGGALRVIDFCYDEDDALNAAQKERFLAQSAAARLAGACGADTARLITIRCFPCGGA